MARPPSDPRVLELRGAYRHDPNRRRYVVPARGPMRRKPDPDWTPALKAAWRSLLADAPPSPDLLQISDRRAFAVFARWLVILNESEVGSPMWRRAAAAFQFYAGQFGFTPAARRRLCW